MLLHQLGEDLVLALELGLQVGDLLVLGVGGGLAALVVGGEGGGAVLEELLLPVVEDVDGDTVLREARRPSAPACSGGVGVSQVFLQGNIAANSPEGKFQFQLGQYTRRR
ncbi:MAG TPA: hypothetical protein VFD73_23435 [Gemmatimonadales bacterium]|nr:hypothetical protein [Gemmatimonadales bacterium]